MKKRDENEKLQKDKEELENRLKRALADYQNLEKRISDEKSEWVKMANKDLLLKLLPVFDTLNLAQRHIQDEGLILSVKQFLDVLKSVGVERINTQNQAFDPSLMEVVEKTGEEGKILEETRAGFTLFGKMLRPAQVKVG